MGSDKLWLDVGGQPLIAWTLAAVAASGVAAHTVVVAPVDVWSRLRDLHAGRGGELVLLEGGGRRQDSVRAALEECVGRGADVICVHDAARPLCPPGLLTSAVMTAGRAGAVTAGIPVVDSIKQVDDDRVVTATLDRSRLVAVQTPQAFRAEVLVEAHRRAATEDRVAADDCALVEATGHPVRVIPGDQENFKVTTPHDLAVLRSLIGARS